MKRLMIAALLGLACMVVAVTACKQKTEEAAPPAEQAAPPAEQTAPQTEQMAPEAEPMAPEGEQQPAH